MRSRPHFALLLAFPGLALAVAGLFHPHSLSYDTADLWFGVHVPGLLVFPLVGAALAALVHGRTDAISWVVRLAAYVYATFYSALDVISGIAAGYVTRELGPGVARPDEVRLLFRIGTPLGEIGSWALLGCCLALVVDFALRREVAALPAVALVLGAWLVHTDHIFSPAGVAGMAILGVATGLAAWLLGRGLPETRGSRKAT
ncbi:MAG: hypothetical protein WKF79_12485 [Nocardioides sp.]